MRGNCISPALTVALLIGRSNAAPPPDALEDAATEAQRASAAMHTSSIPSTKENATAKPADGGAQPENSGKTQ